MAGTNKTDLVVGLVMLDKFSKTFEKFDHDMEKGKKSSAAFGSALSGIGAGLSIAAVTAFGMESVKAYGNALQSQQKLEMAYEKFPALNDVNIKSMEDYNAALSKKIAYTEADITSAEANLALFKLTGSQIQQMTPLVADLARKNNIDLATASTAVGKALMGNARILKPLGINFKATGDRAKDFTAVQEALTGSIGGLAETFAKDNPLGQLDALKVSFEELQVSIGGALAPAMTGLVNIIKPFVTLLTTIPGPMLQIGAVMLAVSFGTRRLNGALIEHRAAAAAAAASALELAGAEEVGFAAIGREGAAAFATSGAMRVLTAAQTTAAAAGRGLMAALGGPWGIAILAATTAVSLFMMKQDEASTPIDNWTASLERQNGALTENSKAQVVNRLATDGVLDSVTKLGISVEDYTAAVFDGGDARDKLIDDLRKIQMANKDDSPRSGIDRLQNGAAAYTELGNAAKTAADALGSTSQMLADSARFSEQAAAATDKTAAATNQALRETVAYNAALKVELATQNMMAPALARTIAALYAPKRDVAGGETIDAWLKRYTDYMVQMGQAADTTAPAVQDVSSATKTLTGDQQDALDKANRLGEALKSIGDARDSLVSGVKSAGLSYGGIFGFDVNGGVEASKAVTDALQAVAEARATRDAIGPGDDDARAKAQLVLADAIAKVGEAQDAAAQKKLTGENVLSSYSTRLSNLRKFGKVMAMLASKGLAPMIYQDILNQGVDGGLEMAKAINQSPELLGQFNSTAVGFATSANKIAKASGSYLFDNKIGAATTAYNQAYGAAPSSDRGQTIVVKLTLDGKDIVKSIRMHKRTGGGVSLGL